MSLILENLYLGALYDISNYELLTNLGITHIITVSKGILPLYPEKFTYKTIQIDDSPDENLIKHLDSSYEFIEKALSNSGKVFVHCAYGISRSPSVVIAYLMKKYSWNYDTTFKFVFNKRNKIYPNEGFIKQLLEYERTLLIKPKNETNEKEYKCRSCRNVLCKEKEIIHGLEKKCTSIFVEFLNIEEDKDNIRWDCTKCKGKLGEIRLSGIKCSCGEWIAPGFQIHKSKID